MLLTLVCARESFAGGPTDYGTPIINNPPPSRPNPPERHGGTLDDGDVDKSAIIAECGWTGRIPRGNPFDNGGSLNLAWQDGYLDISNFQWSRSFANSRYNNAMCELFMMEQLSKDGTARVRDRCEARRDQILAAATDGGSKGGHVSSISAASTFFGSSNSSSSSNTAATCTDADSSSGNERFACRVVALRDLESSPNTLKDYGAQVLQVCEDAGADMKKRMSKSEYDSYTNSGVYYMGSSCAVGGQSGPGTIIVQNKKSTLETVFDGLNGALKIAAPLYVLNDANKRANQTAQLVARQDYKLGFPSGSYSGSDQGGGYGHGYGYSGYGGACPYGTCGGNGGVVVGGGYTSGGYGGGYGVGYGAGYPGAYAGGGYAGGTCGVPPYAPYYSGCGANNANYMGMTGAPGYGANPWTTGGSAVPSVYGGGIGAPGYGAGIGGGYGGGYPYTNGVSGLPGAFGTLNGGNGWGGNGLNMGSYGPGGLYGQTPFQGSGAGAYNTQQATLMAQQMQAYAQQVQRQADLAAKAQTNYQEDLNALNKTYSKSYQSYMAAQTASAGLSSLGSATPGFGATGYGGGVPGYGVGATSYQQYPTNTGVYYPPYNSGGSSLSFGLNYSH